MIYVVFRKCFDNLLIIKSFERLTRSGFFQIEDLLLFSEQDICHLLLWEFVTDMCFYQDIND